MMKQYGFIGMLVSALPLLSHGIVRNTRAVRNTAS